jgi:hypothetical protein
VVQPVEELEAELQTLRSVNLKVLKAARFQFWKPTLWLSIEFRFWFG